MNYKVEGEFNRVDRRISSIRDSVNNILGERTNNVLPWNSTVWGTLESMHKQAVNKEDFFKLVNEKEDLRGELIGMKRKYEELLRFLKVEFFEERVVQGHMGITTRGYRKISK